jgi:hypothetical protein
MWSPDGSAIIYTDGDALYLAARPDFQPRDIFHSHRSDLCWAQMEWAVR